MPWLPVSEPPRAVAQFVSYLFAVAVAVTFCLSTYLFVAFTRIDAEVYAATHRHLQFYWGIALGLAAAMLALIGIAVWHKRKLINTTTRMRQTENAMAQNQERYRLLESAVNGGIWDWNISTDDCYYSPRWKEILGFDDNDLPNSASTFFNLLHPDDHAMVTEALQAHIKNGNLYRLAKRLRCKDGEYRWMMSRGRVIYDDGERPVRMLGVMVDITERKKAEAEMAESRDNLARAEQMARLGHFRCAQGSPERIWSDGLYRIFGKSRETFTPTAENIMAQFHPDDRPILEQRHREFSAGVMPPSRTLRIIRDDGQIAYVEDMIDLMHADDGTLIGRFGTLQDVTARVQTEAQIAESRDNLARAEEMARLGHFKFEFASGKITWSAGTYRIFGKTPDTFEPTPDSVVQLFHPDDRPTLLAHRRALMDGAEPPPVTHRIVKNDGQISYLEVRSQPLRASDGSVIGLFGTIQDVTARKRAQALIAESRDRLAHAEELARLGHFKFELGTAAITWSAGTYRIFGRSPDKFTPTLDNIAEFVHPDDRLAHQHYRQSVLDGAEMPPFIHRAIRGDGELIHLEVRSKPLRARDGAIIGRFGTVQDITPRIKAQALIAESRDRLARAEEMALIGHFKFEPGAEHVWSPGAFRVFGKSPETFTPTAENVLDLFHPDDRPVMGQYREIVMAGGEPPPGMFRIVKDNGELAYIEVWPGALRASDGAVIGMFGTIQDVTARKRAEEALERINHELETRVAERTEALAQEIRRRAEVQLTLAQLQKMEAVGQLSAGVAHDFNNLLAVIGGGLEFIERAASRSLPADLELIEAALRATRRGRDLVQRLLTFSRQSPLSAEPTVIDQMVLDTLRLLQRTLGEDIEIVTRLDATGTLVSVDRNQLANALVNLALNARDAMPEGGRLTISTAFKAAASKANGRSQSGAIGEHVCITIADTGVGMTDEARTRAFEPFFTTKRDGLSSGLGLSMVLGFVQQSGGDIHIDSKVGNGTTVTISLPRIEATAQSHDIGDPTPLCTDGHDKTVLLVEDDPDVRVVVAAQLKDLGYNVQTVATAMEAIGVIESPASIAAILTDIVLPGEVDGVTLLKEVLRTRPRIGVLCMSGYNPSRRHRKWLQVQNIELLEKPFSRTQLAQALDATLAQ